MYASIDEGVFSYYVYSVGARHWPDSGEGSNGEIGGKKSQVESFFDLVAIRESLPSIFMFVVWSVLSKFDLKIYVSQRFKKLQKYKVGRIGDKMDRRK